jgi:heat shock protein HtpX
MIGFLLFALCSLAFSVGLSLLVFFIGPFFNLNVVGGTHLASLALHCLVIGMAGSLASLLFSRRIAIISMGVQIIETPQNDAEYFLMREIEVLASKSGLAMPQVGIFYSSQINAFATGPTKNRSLVAVSSALLEGMEADEARAVLAHEIGHVRSGDMVWMTIINGVANSLVFFFSSILASAILSAFNQKSRDGSTMTFRIIIEFILQFFLGLISTVFVMAFSRYREYRADAQAAQLVGKQHMIAALQRLESANRCNEESLPPSMKAFGVFGKAGAFASHPSVEDRIEALRSERYA